jgi:hypothetical protein
VEVTTAQSTESNQVLLSLTAQGCPPRHVPSKVCAPVQFFLGYKLIIYHRTSSAKPGDSLLADFRQQFPQLAATSSATTAPGISQTAAPDNALAPADV